MTRSRFSVFALLCAAAASAVLAVFDPGPSTLLIGVAVVVGVTAFIDPILRGLRTLAVGVTRLFGREQWAVLLVAFENRVRTLLRRLSPAVGFRQHRHQGFAT